MARLGELNRFLEEIYSHAPVPLSIKTRIGVESGEEFQQILDIYNQYPVHELTIHPRVQKDFYKNRPDWEVFAEALAASKNPVCYNGDINTLEDYHRFCERFPSVERIMIGRGLIANPGLVREIRTGQETEWQEIIDFAGKLYENYREIMPDNPVLFKMKEVWSYMSERYSEAGRLWKRIKKTKRLSDYEKVIRITAQD